MRMVVRVFLIVVMIILSSIPASAGEKDILTLLRQDSLEAAPEKKEILQLLQKRTPTNTNSLGDIQGYFEGRQVSVNSGNIIKIYHLTENFISAYENGKKFKDIISNDYQWYVPVYDKTSKKVIGLAVVARGITVEEAKERLRTRRSWSFLKWIMEYESRKEYIELVRQKEGKWYIQQVATGLAMPESEINLFTNKDNIAELLMDAGIENPDIIKYVRSAGRFMDILYIKRGDSEYGVPFGGRPDFTGLQNGKVYKISDIVSILKKAGTENPQPYKRSLFENFIEYDWIFIVLSISGITVIRMLYRRGKNPRGF